MRTDKYSVHVSLSAAYGVVELDDTPSGSPCLPDCLLPTRYQGTRLVRGGRWTLERRRVQYWQFKPYGQEGPGHQGSTRTCRGSPREEREHLGIRCAAQESLSKA